MSNFADLYNSVALSAGLYMYTNIKSELNFRQQVVRKSKEDVWPLAFQLGATKWVRPCKNSVRLVYVTARSEKNEKLNTIKRNVAEVDNLRSVITRGKYVLDTNNWRLDIPPNLPQPYVEFECMTFFVPGAKPTPGIVWAFDGSGALYPRCVSETVFDSKHVFLHFIPKYEFVKSLLDFYFDPERFELDPNKVTTDETMFHLDDLELATTRLESESVFNTLLIQCGMLRPVDESVVMSPPNWRERLFVLLDDYNTPDQAMAALKECGLMHTRWRDSQHTSFPLCASEQELRHSAEYEGYEWINHYLVLFDNGLIGEFDVTPDPSRELRGVMGKETDFATVMYPKAGEDAYYPASLVLDNKDLQGEAAKKLGDDIVELMQL